MKNHIRLFIKASSILAMCILFLIKPIFTFAFYENQEFKDFNLVCYYPAYPISSQAGSVSNISTSSKVYGLLYNYSAVSSSSNSRLRGKCIVYCKDSGSLDIYRGSSTLYQNINFNTLYKNSFYYAVIDNPIANNRYITYGSDTDKVDLTSLNDVLEYIYNGSTSDDLGYIQNVGYHVDAYGLENNPVGTNEVVSWADESTSGIDLTQDKYSVEFMIKDTSMEFKNSISQSMEGFINIPRPLDSVVDFAADTFYNIASLFAADDDEKAFMQGKSIPAETYGKCVSITTVQAKNKQAALPTMKAYGTWARTGSTEFKTYITSLYGSTSRNDWFSRALEVWNQKDHYYNLSYDIYARIIDTTTDNKGDWLLIDKHNTPYINSDRSDRLNGGVTAVTGIRFPDYNPIEDDFTDPPAEEPAYQPDDDSDPIYLPTPISTGYVIYDGGSSSSSSSSTLINNYYNTTYVYNYGDQISNINIDNSDYNNFNEGIDTIKALPDFLGLYLTFFGSFLPTWAVAIVSICIPLLISIIIIRIVKGVLPFV